ncbi:chemotaxis protein CheA [Iocasia frigidifontis]|uniref:Chemotaxis protein CheA n=1 Tax=Iocasia fonsfrigidae TaxID=2682810 RepID=A0A8A7KKQ7_9FIRM|nr:chemotaxis protein CheA [Iocasia fonsfrigidae]QTL98432.1 chemotaxis protein CheA [Iocasia fonsfrigidae]
MENNNQYLQMFFDESAEYLQLLNENVLLLEESPDDEEIINAVFRAAHSVKGMSATMGFDRLTDLTHKIENILAKVRNKELSINEDIIDLLFAGLDYIKSLVEDIRSAGEENTDVSAYLQELDNCLNHSNDVIDDKGDLRSDGDLAYSSYLKLNEEEEKNIANKMKDTDCVYNIEVILDKSCLLKNVRGYMVLKKAQEIGYLAKSNPTQKEIEDEDFGDSIYIILVSTLDSESIIKEFKNIVDVAEVKIDLNDLKSTRKVETSVSNKKKTSSKNEKKKKTSLSNMQVSPTVRVDINKLDNLMNMVGELLINKTRLEGLNIKTDIYQDIIQQLDRVTMDLHHIVMQIRMVPIGGIFNRFPRMVRDLSKELNKEINLMIEGADTELDRSIIDELADPLMHIIRNSADHGVETPEVRKAKGKAFEGVILLNAYQKGSEIIIEVEDDGKGIDVDMLTEKALEKGIITVEDIEDMDEKDKLQLVFHPGFSTSEKVTDVSGRGVGMDVVKRVVESLDGQVYIESEKDVGTRFTISLPLTLAITQALMVKIDDEIFAIPLGTISETIMIKPDEIQQVRGQDVIILRDTTIPLVEGSRQLNLNVEYGQYINKEEIPAVIINSGEKQIGLIVDELLNQQEIVIKSLGNYLINIKNISGATIVGDGDVALILDVRNIA